MLKYKYIITMEVNYMFAAAIAYNVAKVVIIAGVAYYVNTH